MQLEYRRGNTASNTRIEDRDPKLRDHRDRLHLARLSGRGASVDIGSGYATLWVCLRGNVEIETDDGLTRLARRTFLFTPEGMARRGVSRVGGDWFVIALPPALLGRIARTSGLRGTPDPLIFSTRAAVTRQLLRALIALSRLGEAGIRAPERGQLKFLMADLLHTTVQAQDHVAEWVDRALGRTEGHRRRVVARLLRARNRIVNEPFGRHDIESLALASRYSKSHFIRLFREVFGVTPHDLLTIERLDMAKELIAESNLAISEVAASVGFESRFAFSRLFRKRVGMSASEYRRAA